MTRAGVGLVASSHGADGELVLALPCAASVGRPSPSKPTTAVAAIRVLLHPRARPPEREIDILRPPWGHRKATSRWVGVGSVAPPPPPGGIPPFQDRPDPSGPLGES